MTNFVDLTIATMAVGAILVRLSTMFGFNNILTTLTEYGKLVKTGAPQSVLSNLQVPKSWFQHFYTFGTIYSGIGLVVAINVYVCGAPVPEFVTRWLDCVYGKDRQALVSPLTALISITLFFIHLLRRAYETYFVQIFSPTKMSIVPYLMGFLYYFCVVTSILGRSAGFASPKVPATLTLSDFNIRHQICVPFFLYAMWNQHLSNRILAKMRQDSTGRIVSMAHVIPRGGFFEVVSSPHMFFEIEIYIAAVGLLNENPTWTYILVMVVVNQVHIALETHRWYLTKFKEYPKGRKAIFPNLL